MRPGGIKPETRCALSRSVCGLRAGPPAPAGGSVSHTHLSPRVRSPWRPGAVAETARIARALGKAVNGKKSG